MNKIISAHRIGIFGGAFNPVHKGHVKVVESFLKCGLIEKLLLLPTPAPPHKKSKDLAGLGHRINMLNLVFKGNNKIEVSKLEADLPSPSYSLQTIRHLRKKYPDKKFFLCLGEDSLVDFETWYKHEKILNLVPILAAERPGFDSNKVADQILENTIFVDHKPVDYSSSGYRKPGREDDSQLPNVVLDYIDKHNLYTHKDRYPE